jgi:CHAT domain-containing protein
VSKVTPGQGILGLTATLLSRQTATVIAPVVAIDDAETTALMVGYHRRLRAGRSPAEALAEAQAEHGQADPRSRATAAAFLCLGVGDQRPVDG